MSDLQAALVDTDAFSRLFVRRGSSDPRITNWFKLLAGRRVLVSFQTRSELLAGAIADNWGERKAAELRAILDLTPTIGVDDEVIDAHATLYAECRRVGHPLHEKSHTGDRWIAACAVAKDLPLMTGDSIYQGAPNLTLLI